jgi:hypothetical protein
MAAAAAAPAGVRDVDAREHEITDEQRRVVEESWEKMQRTLSTTRQRCHWDRKMVSGESKSARHVADLTLLRARCGATCARTSGTPPKRWRA